MIKYNGHTGNTNRSFGVFCVPVAILRTKIVIQKSPQVEFSLCDGTDIPEILSKIKQIFSWQAQSCLRLILFDNYYSEQR